MLNGQNGKSSGAASYKISSSISTQFTDINNQDSINNATINRLLENDQNNSFEGKKKTKQDSSARKWSQVNQNSYSYMLKTYRVPFFQVLALLPVYLLQVSYGMNSGYPAIMTPQLREDCSEFSITTDEESWIGMNCTITLQLTHINLYYFSFLVSIDNVATPFVCILSGFLQQKFGPLKVH